MIPLLAWACFMRMVLFFRPFIQLLWLTNDEDTLSVIYRIALLFTLKGFTSKTFCAHLVRAEIQILSIRKLVLLAIYKKVKCKLYTFQKLQIRLWTEEDPG